MNKPAVILGVLLAIAVIILIGYYLYVQKQKRTIMAMRTQITKMAQTAQVPKQAHGSYGWNLARAMKYIGRRLTVSLTAPVFSYAKNGAVIASYYGYSITFNSIDDIVDALNFIMNYLRNDNDHPSDDSPLFTDPYFKGENTTIYALENSYGTFRGHAVEYPVEYYRLNITPSQYQVGDDPTIFEGSARLF